MRRHRAKLLLTIAVIVAVALPFLLSRGLAGRFRKRYAPERVAERVSGISAHNSRRKLAAYWSFDKGETAAPSRGIGVGTVAARGVHRDALRFNGHDDTFFATEFLWQLSGDFSISFWLKAMPLPVRQDIIFQGRPHQLGFRLDNGTLTFDLTISNNVFSASIPFDKFGEFAHVAAVVEPERHVVSLYLNGELKGKVVLDGFLPSNWHVDFGRSSRDGKHHAMAGVLDEVALWNKALSKREVARLASSPGATRRAALGRARRLRMEKYLFLSSVASALDRIASLAEFSPVRYWRAKRARASLRHVGIVIGKSRLRHLYKAHARSAASGHRTAAASRQVPAYALFNGKTLECMVSLSGGTLCYPGGARPSFILEALADGPCVAPARRILLAPPESAGWLSRLADGEAWRIAQLPSPPPSAELVTLSVNGRSMGVFLMCDATRQMVHPGEGIDPLSYHGRKQLEFQREAEFARLMPQGLSPRVAAAMGGLFTDGDFRRYAKALASDADIICADAQSPVPASLRAKAIAQSLESVLKRPAPAEAGMFLLDEFLLLGKNPAPWLVSDNLDLTAVRAPEGWRISFKSDSPEWLDDNGHLLKRPGRSPQPVSVRATIQDASGTRSERKLAFRLVPEEDAMPALFVWTPVPFDRAHRTDASVELPDAEHPDSNPAPVFFATAAGGAGGVRYRGNTSFQSRKKLLSIKLDTPHGLFGDGSASRSLLAINANTDHLRVWNTLAFDAFREFPRNDGLANVSPHVRTFELFVNGLYWGPCEFAQRIDENLVGEMDAVVFRHMTARPRVPFVRQTQPPARGADAMPLYHGLIADLEAARGGDAAALDSAASKLDVQSLIDYQILFSVFANSNSGAGDFWTQDVIAYSRQRGKFFFIPWDFDCSAAPIPPQIFSTNLDRLFAKAVPGHVERMARRWFELRRSVLSEEWLLRNYDAIVERNFAYLPFESARWNGQSRSRAGFEALREKGRNFICAQLEALDKIFKENSKSNETN